MEIDTLIRVLETKKDNLEVAGNPKNKERRIAKIRDVLASLLWYKGQLEGDNGTLKRLYKDQIEEFYQYYLNT